MSTRIFFLIGLIFLFPIVAVKANETVSKKDWIEMMQAKIPSASCEEDLPFRKCFNITQNECIETAIRGINTCFKKISPKIPSKLKQPKDVEKWGALVGACVARHFQGTLSAKIIDSPYCRQ